MFAKDRYVYPYGLRRDQILRVGPVAARLCLETYRDPTKTGNDRLAAAQVAAHVSLLVYGAENMQQELRLNLEAVGANPEAAAQFAELVSAPGNYEKLVPRELTNGNDQALLLSVLQAGNN